MPATLTVIWWRDIPAQVVAKDGRRAVKIVLHPRFQVAIDKAAVKAGKRAMDDYIEEWRKTAASRAATTSRREATAEAARLEAAYGRRRPGRASSPPAASTGRASAGMTRTVVGSATREVVIGVGPAVRRSSASGSTRPAGSSSPRR